MSISTANNHRRLHRFLFLLPLAIALFTGAAYAQPERSPEKNTILLTVFLKHDQTKTLDEIQAQLRKNAFYQKFPPEGVEVISWYVMMGLGQVVTLRLPPERLRAVNLAIEQNGWGAFRTEFYPTYDYKPIWQQEGRKSPAQ
jgi:uncharacterized protein with GYD domain